MIFLIDNGHGIDTPGKRSPDGRFLEYLFNRQVAQILADRMVADGFDARLVVPETNDVTLRTRVNRINRVWNNEGYCVVTSIHANAAGDGSHWMSARGFSCFTSPGETESDRIADRMYESYRTEFPTARFRTDFSDGDQDWESNLYILRKTLCPAVLLENWFYDNLEECCWLMKESTREHIAMAIYWGLINWYRKDFDPDRIMYEMA